MRNDADLQACTSRTGRSSGFFPTSIRAVFRNVSASASNLTATVHSARSSVASTISMVEDERQREQVQWAGFDRLESGAAVIRHVLLLTYVNGFQVLDVEEADDVRELVSKRDGPVAFLRVQPQPFIEASEGGLKSARPLLLVVTGDVSNCSSTGVPGGLNGENGVGNLPSSLGGSHFAPTVIKFYSLRSRTYVHTLRFPTYIHAVRCSPRVVAVALVSQLYCFDAATLQNTFSVLTYPSPQAGANGLNVGYGAMAVGPRWLAYAASQPLISNIGRVSPQHLTPPRVSPTPANGSLVVHYAKESSKQFAAGIFTLKDMGYKRWSRYCSERLTEGAGSPVLGSPSWKNSCNGSLPYPHDPEHAGTVIVRDFVNKTVVAQFRAHTSPLSALCFDPSGTLLVTASIHGHSINVFRIMPMSSGGGSSAASFDAHASYVHLYKLSRGLTNALIQDITFSEDSNWIVVISSRGTSHLFAISPFGGTVGPHTHGTIPVNHAAGQMVSMPNFPWWSNTGPVKSSQQSSLPPPLAINLSVVSRIKNGSNGWCGTVSAAAAAASNGRSSSSSGAVAVVFHDGGGPNLESETGQNRLKEQLWVLSSSGHLIRYDLHLSVGMEGLYSKRIPSGMVVGAQCSSKEAVCLRVAVQASQRWDVCRRPNWAEREERIDNLIAPDAAHDEANTVGTPSYVNVTSIGCCSGNGRHGREEMLPEEMHRWFMSNAEVQMHHSKEPIWAKSQITFHVFTGAAKNRFPEKGDFGGETEIEKVPTRVVEVRKKDLVPVFDSLNDFKSVKGHRDDYLPLKDTVKLPDLRLQFLRGNGLQDRFVGTNCVGVQVQHSSCGIYCGSDGSLSTGANIGRDGYHPLYQDRSQDLQTVSFPHYLEPSTSFLHQIQPRQLYLEKANRHNEIASVSDKIKDMKHVPSGSLVGSRLVNIPKAGHQYVYDMAPRLGEKPGVDNRVGLEGLHKRIILPLNGAVGVPIIKTKHICDISIACEGQIEAGSSPRSYNARSAVIDHLDPSFNAISDQLDPSAMEGIDLHLLQTQSSGDSEQASGGASNAILNHARECHLQDYQGTMEDVESPDANSKEGEQGNDAWEGAMFPFTEDC